MLLHTHTNLHDPSLFVPFPTVDFLQPHATPLDTIAARVLDMQLRAANIFETHSLHAISLPVSDFLITCYPVLKTTDKPYCTLKRHDQTSTYLAIWRDASALLFVCDDSGFQDDAIVRVFPLVLETPDSEAPTTAKNMHAEETLHAYLHQDMQTWRAFIDRGLPFSLSGGIPPTSLPVGFHRDFDETHVAALIAAACHSIDPDVANLFQGCDLFLHRITPTGSLTPISLQKIPRRVAFEIAHVLNTNPRSPLFERKGLRQICKLSAKGTYGAVHLPLRDTWNRLSFHEQLEQHHLWQDLAETVF